MSKDIHQLRILIADQAAMNRELRARLEIAERCLLEMGCGLAVLNQMHDIGTEEPSKHPDPRKPLLQ